MKYANMSRQQLADELSALKKAYSEYEGMHLKLDMSRGSPCREQLDLTLGMLHNLDSAEACRTENGMDCRNYGVLDGIPEAKKLFGDLLEVPPQNVIVYGNSSLNIMYDTVARAMLYGVCGGTPWCRLEHVKFLCPAPGYDRHFAICQSLGIEMITVPMTEAGPDMDMVERLVSEDEAIKGIWCVPKYSNPEGVVYSAETVLRFAALKPKAKDFRIFWDNAYVIHSLYDTCDEIPNLFTEAAKAGNPDMPFIFASTSKISFPGSGVAVLAASDRNISQIKSIMTIQTIGHDKLNQLRHVRFFHDVDGLRTHMKKHAEILRPKFEYVLEAFDRDLTDPGVATWTKPRGGYFISLDVMDGTAKRVYELMQGIGVTLTKVGATFPYGIDPDDRNLRIAPSFPPLEDLRVAVDALCLCVKLAAAEKLLG